MACNFKPYEGNEKYIFVSYAHADGNIVYPILERLNEAGYRIWYDEGIEWGTEFNEYIATHIDDCDVVIAFHSNASNKSDYCKREINYAINNVKKSILSVYLEEVKFSSGMVMQLSPYQSTFWYQYEDKERFFERLINGTSILEPCRSNVASSELATEIVKSHREQATEYEEKCDIRNPERSFIGVENYYEKDSEVSEQLAKESETVESRQDQAMDYRYKAFDCEMEGNFTEARKLYEKSIEILEQLVKETGTEYCKHDLSLVYICLGEICEREKNLTEARKFYEKNIEVCEQLVKEIGTVDERRDLYISYDLLGNVYKLEDNLPEARNLYEKSLEIKEQLVKETRMVWAYEDLAESYYKIAMIVPLPEDISFLRKAEATLKELVKQCPEKAEKSRYERRLESVRQKIKIARLRPQ